MSKHIYGAFDLELFGRRLNRRREQLGWTRAYMADKFGISHTHAANMCRGVKSAPSMDLLFNICETMNVSADYLLGFTPSPYVKNDNKKIENEIDRRYNIAQKAYADIGLEVPADLKDLIENQVVNELEKEEENNEG